MAFDREYGNGISADRHEARVAERKQSCKARKHRHAKDGDDIDAYHYDNALYVAVNAKEVAEGGIYILK